MKAWEALQRIKDGEIVDTYFGICFSMEGVHTACDVWNEHQFECYKEWPEFTGSTAYPVPCKEMKPSTAYIRTHHRDMWNPKHQYGAARLRLLDHCIEWFKEKNL